jgi:hypothetical protein
MSEAPLDSLPFLSQSASTKRKILLNNHFSLFRPRSPTQFDEPDPKRIKLPDSQLPIAQKLDKVFDYLKTLEWTTEDFLKHLFAPKTHTSTRSQRHGLIMEQFLSGRDHYTVSKLLESMWITFDGAGHHSADMYSVAIPYLEMRPVRAAISLFAAQIVETRLLEEAQVGIDEDNGMHASITSRNEAGRVEWASIGASLIPAIQANLSQHMPLAFHYMLRIAEPRPRKRKGAIAVRIHRPPNLVSYLKSLYTTKLITRVTKIATQALCSLLFGRSGRARLLPITLGILYLASCVPVDIFAINSRLGIMPVINTVKSVLKGFSDQKAVAIRTRGRDTSTKTVNGCVMTRAILLIFDNVQHFMKQRDFRMGRENSMIIRIAATYIELEVKAVALDVQDKRRRIEQNLRKEVDMQKILGLIDQDHFKRIGRLQWIQALTNHP